MQYTIQNGRLSVTADSFGAQLLSVKQGGKEWLWQNPTGNWDGHAPLLFPICGLIGCKINGVKYPLGRHGFAKKSQFELSEKGEDFLRFTLKSNDNTKKVYPFDFTYQVTYRIIGSKLCVEHVVQNDGDMPMYFMCGGHESFDLPMNVENYAIEFEKEEHFVHHFHSETGMTGETLDFGKGKFLPIPAHLIQNNNTAIFPDIVSRKIWLCEKNGKRLAQITFAQEFKNLLLWRSFNDSFICIEPWTNVLDKDGVPDVEFSTKKGVIKVNAGERKILNRSVEYL